MRRGIAAIVAAVAALTLVGCARADGATASRAGTASPAAATVRIVGEADANLQLWVSNQSFVDGTVAVTVRIDDTAVVGQRFEVQGQHNWILFTIAVAAGPHVLEATSDTGAELRQAFTLPEQGRRYAVVDYWYYPDDGDGRHFSWQLSSTPVRFA